MLDDRVSDSWKIIPFVMTLYDPSPHGVSLLRRPLYMLRQILSTVSVLVVGCWLVVTISDVSLVMRARHSLWTLTLIIMRVLSGSSSSPSLTLIIYGFTILQKFDV